MLENLSAFAVILLSISLASERLVTIIKTLFPKLADEKKNEAQQTDLVKDKWRRFVVQIIAFISSWVTSAFLVKGGFDLLGSVELAKQMPSVPVFVLGILASGGSSLWNNVLLYTKAVKDIRISDGAGSNLELAEKTEQLGATPRAKKQEEITQQTSEMMKKISGWDQPLLSTYESRI
jgi:hypothetical protein